MPVFIIAEAGVNHNGDLEMARRLVDQSAEAGADAVKFQTFRADTLVRRDAPKADYQKETTGEAGGQHDMLRALELSEAAHIELAQRCKTRGIEFLSTPFDEESADLLERIGVRRYKLASGEVTNLPLLRHVAAKGKPIILSTGMSLMPEIAAAVDALRRAKAGDLTLLHCVSDYPTRPQDVNLRVIPALAARFGLPVGFSDHTQGISASLAAVALGAAAIEKHVTIDKSLPGPDHRASLDFAELKAMIRGIREIEPALGDGEKRLTPGEESNLRVVRRSLVAAEDLAPGTVLQARHVKAKRPATGLSPMELDRILGRKVKQAIRRDRDILPGDLD